MTRFEFELLCGEYLIDLNMALESEEMQVALSNGSEEDEIRRVFEESF